MVEGLFIHRMRASLSAAIYQAETQWTDDAAPVAYFKVM